MRIWRIGVVAASCAAVALQAFFLRDPGKNWDRLAYYAIALKIEGRTDTQAHLQAYEAAETSMSPSAYARLTGQGLEPNAYRRVVAQDERAFSQQLRFYWRRVGYTYSLALLFRLGIPIPLAATFLSLVPALALAIGGTLRLMRGPLTVAGATWAGAFALVVLLTRVVGLHGPDAAGLFFACLGTLLLLDGGKWWGVPAVAVAVLFREDYALYAMCLACALVCFPSDRSRRYQLPSALSIVVVALCAATWWLFPAYSFATLAHHGFVSRLPYPAESQVTWSVLQQAVALQKGLPLIVVANWHVVLLAVVVLVEIVLTARKRPLERKALAATALALAYLAIRVLAFPAAEQRFYGIVGLLLVGILGAIFVRPPAKGEKPQA